MPIKIEQIVNVELQNLNIWLFANRLTLNVKKTNFIIFRPYQKKICNLPKLIIFDYDQNKNVSLEYKEYTKFLGILIDSNLSWKHHIDDIANKISKVVGTIAKLRHFVPLNTLLSIYNSLILPYFTYGLIAWGQGCKSHLNKILILQKQVLRLIFFANKNDHSIPFFISAKILPIDFLYYKILAVMMFDVDNNSVPPNNTRSSKSKNFYIKNSRLNIQKNAFSSEIIAISRVLVSLHILCSHYKA
jgi:hypothetical protein